MCGIAGLIDSGMSRHEIQATLKRMTDSFVYRGPDEEGFAALDGVGLGIRRLSIIDVAGGQQPIASEDGHVQVVCNGEIYNYVELRQQLRQRGHRFQTESDAEVIVHLYEEQGVGCLNELRGMFGLAIWDARARRLVVGRDRLGKKPLFYSHRAGRLLFGSEIKAILAADPGLAEENIDALIPYLRFGYLAEPTTMFRNIHKLPAGNFLTYENDQITIASYWEMSPEFDTEPRDEKDWAEELDALLEESVRIRLRSDVPLGVFLSGGLDSSAIVAYAHRAGLQPLKTFTIAFDRPEWDESPDAQVVARHFQTDHHVLTLREADLSRDLPSTLLTLVRHFDEPFADASALPTYHVSRMAREHVTVILSGDGGDELFAGYTIYQGLKFAEHYRRLPKWLFGRLVPELARCTARCLTGRSRHAALHVAKVLRDSTLPFESTYYSKATAWSEEALQQLLTPGMVGGANLAEQLYLRSDLQSVMRSKLPLVSKMSYIDLCCYLRDDILVKVDRMSMAHSLEVRCPILDHRLVEFALRIPPSLKLRGWKTKAILRDVLRPHLPPRTRRKRKQGFSVPLREWLRNGLGEMVDDYLNSDNGRLPPEVFDRSAVATLLREHRQGDADHSSKIWTLLNYAAWRDHYIYRRAS